MVVVASSITSMSADDLVAIGLRLLHALDGGRLVVSIEYDGCIRFVVPPDIVDVAVQYIAICGKNLPYNNMHVVAAIDNHIVALVVLISVCFDA